jgi:urease accessory protein
LSRRLRPSGFGGPAPDPSGFGGQGDDLALLRLLQLFDSQFPVGAFAHSSGLESYAALDGSVPELRQVLQAQIELGWGRSELAAAYLAWRDAGSCPGSPKPEDRRRLDALAQTMDALKVVPSIRETSIGLGRRTLDLVRRLYPGAALEISRPHHAIVVGAAARRLGVDAPDLLLAFAHSLALGTLTAAIRCMPVSPAQAQELLVEAHPRMSLAVERTIADPEGSLFTCTPALDIRSHQQAFLHTRLFQS